MSCIEGDTPDEEIRKDDFIENIERNFTEIEADSIVYLSSDSIYQPSRLVSSDNCNHLIIGDASDHSIVLINKNGELISKVGGEGRGPGEFQSILDLHIGSDNRLYVLDGLEFRISIFTIGANSLDYIKSVAFKNPANHFLTSLHITEFGQFGVYQESDGYFSAENHFLLYRLDKDFNPQELLLRMPGNERQKVETSNFTYYAPYKYLSRTIWYFDNEWFHYITTTNSFVHKYNVRTGIQEEITIHPFDNRANSPDYIQSVKDHYPVEDESYWSSLNEIENLPFFNGLLVDGNHIYVTLLPSPGFDGKTLVIEPESEEIKYFQTPQEFSPRTVCDRFIYGIDFNVSGEYQMMGFELFNR